MFNFIWYTIPLLRGLIDKKSSLEREQRQISRSTDENIRLQETIHTMRLQEDGHKATLQADIVRLQGDVNLQNTIAEDLHRRFEDASPFLLPLRSVWPMLFSEYTEKELPLLLIAPFWDETQANVANDAGGAQFRVAMADALRDSPWGGSFNIVDGYFKRPLRQTDMDLKIINDALKDIPVAVVFGTLDQHEIRAEIALWNILPGEAPGRRVYIRGKGRMPRDVVIKDNREFKQELGRDLAHAIGQVGAIYNLFQSESQPDVESFLVGDDARDREISARFEEYKCLYDLYRAAAEQKSLEAGGYRTIVRVLLDSRGTLAAMPAARTPSRSVSTLAGTGERGFTNGPIVIATFSYPFGVTIDKAGNAYVADTYNHAIRKITPEGIVSTLAGTGEEGFINGPGASARFNLPFGVTVDSAGNVYVADAGNNAIRRISPTGFVWTVAGTGPPGYANGPDPIARFDSPNGVAVDSVGNVYVADEQNHAIRKITVAGVVSTLAGTGEPGFISGRGAGWAFNGPDGVAVDTAGNLYVADGGNNAIRKISPEGVVSTLAGTGEEGFASGPGITAMFDCPTGVAVDTLGNVYVADSNNSAIRKITRAGVVTTLAGTGVQGYHDGPSGSGTFNSPFGVVVDNVGNVYVADTDNHAIRIVSP